MESLCATVPVAVQQVRTAITKAALRSGRDAGAVTLMAVVKTRSLEEIRAVVGAGITCLGENRVQEGVGHVEAMGPSLRPACRVHFIGRLQTNKARKALPAFDSVDGVDSPRLARLLSRLAMELGLVREILLEVNLGEESQKGGVAPEETELLAQIVHALPGLALTGLMGVCPYDPGPGASRPHYRKLSHLFSSVRRNHPHPGSFQHLSMGMSHDFEIAVEEGATLVRIGQALFGPRRPA
jgi:PLP dependent protein